MSTEQATTTAPSKPPPPAAAPPAPQTSPASPPNTTRATASATSNPPPTNSPSSQAPTPTTAAAAAPPTSTSTAARYNAIPTRPATTSPPRTRAVMPSVLCCAGIMRSVPRRSIMRQMAFVIRRVGSMAMGSGLWLTRTVWFVLVRLCIGVGWGVVWCGVIRWDGDDVYSVTILVCSLMLLDTTVRQRWFFIYLF